MSAEGEEDVTQKKDTRAAVTNGVMRGEDEGAARLLMEQYSTEEGSLIGSERCIDLFGDLPLSPGKGRCNHAKGDALAGDAAKVGDAVEGSVNAGREQRVALLYCVKSVTPLLDGCVARDLGASALLVGKCWSKRQNSSSKAPRGRSKWLGRSSRCCRSREADDMMFSFSGFEPRDALKTQDAYNTGWREQWVRFKRCEIDPRRSCPAHLAEFVVSVHTGMRLSEQYSCLWSQVDLERRTIELTKTKNGPAINCPQRVGIQMHGS
jgi:hypothetical protein